MFNLTDFAFVIIPSSTGHFPKRVRVVSTAHQAGATNLEWHVTRASHIGRTEVPRLVSLPASLSLSRLHSLPSSSPPLTAATARNQGRLCRLVAHSPRQAATFQHRRTPTVAWNSTRDLCPSRLLNKSSLRHVGREAPFCVAPRLVQFLIKCSSVSPPTRVDGSFDC